MLERNDLDFAVKSTTETKHVELYILNPVITGDLRYVISFVKYEHSNIYGRYRGRIIGICLEDEGRLDFSR